MNLVTKLDDSERIEVLEAALLRIADWADSCPIEKYPEPDYRKAHDLLSAGGMSLEIICACNMRHAVEGAGAIAREALNYSSARRAQH